MLKRVCGWAKGERNEQLSAEAQKEVFAHKLLYSFVLHSLDTTYRIPLFGHQRMLRIEKLALSINNAIFIFYAQK